MFQELAATHAETAPFHEEGSRACFEYQDLGVNIATQGGIGAHVIRAVPGEVVLRAGSSALHFPGVVQCEVWHSDDMELLEVTQLVELLTEEEANPNV